MIAGAHRSARHARAGVGRAARVAADDLAPLETVGAALIGAVDRVGAEQAVRESELRFRALAEYSTDFVVVIGADLQLQYLSPAAARFLGMSVADRFDPTDSVLHADDQDRVTLEIAAILGDPSARAVPMRGAAAPGRRRVPLGRVRGEQPRSPSPRSTGSCSTAATSPSGARWTSGSARPSRGSAGSCRTSPRA